LKKISAIFLIVALFFGFSACKKTCQPGYENPNCSVEIRAQFENLNYTVTESKNSDSATSYPAGIIAGANILQVQLTNVGNGAIVHNVVGNVTADTLIIPNQAPDTNAHYIQGIGILSGNTLYLSYTITYPDSQPFLHTQTDYYQGQWVHP
jgi:hypothetical protein